MLDLLVSNHRSVVQATHENEAAKSLPTNYTGGFSPTKEESDVVEVPLGLSSLGCSGLVKRLCIWLGVVWLGWESGHGCVEWVNSCFYSS